MRVVDAGHVREQTPFCYHTATLPLYISRWSRINSCDRGHSPKRKLKDMDQSTVYNVDKMSAVAEKSLAIVPVYAAVFVETLYYNTPTIKIFVINCTTVFKIEQVQLTITAIQNSHQLTASHMRYLRYSDTWITGMIAQENIAYKCLVAEIIRKMP